MISTVFWKRLAASYTRRDMRRRFIRGLWSLGALPAALGSYVADATPQTFGPADAVASMASGTAPQQENCRVCIFTAPTSVPSSCPSEGQRSSAAAAPRPTNKRAPTKCSCPVSGQGTSRQQACTPPPPAISASATNTVACAPCRGASAAAAASSASETGSDKAIESASYTELEVKHGTDSVRLVTKNMWVVAAVLALVAAVLLVPLIGAVRLMLKPKTSVEDDSTTKARVFTGAVVLAVVSAAVAFVVWLALRPGPEPRQAGTSGQPEVRYVLAPPSAGSASSGSSASPAMDYREDFARVREQLQSIDTRTQMLVDERATRITPYTMAITAFAASVLGSLVVVIPLLVLWRRRQDFSPKDPLYPPPADNSDTQRGGAEGS